MLWQLADWWFIVLMHCMLLMTSISSSSLGLALTALFRYDPKSLESSSTSSHSGVLKISVPAHRCQFLNTILFWINYCSPVAVFWIWWTFMMIARFSPFMERQHFINTELCSFCVGAGFLQAWKWNYVAVVLRLTIGQLLLRGHSEIHK